jgi:sulfatase maturation enzyme AslB (radical SAM superfamily)
MNTQDFSKVGCVLPWTQFYMDTDGQSRPCCLSDDPPLHTRQVLHSAKDLREAWNHSQFQKIRREMLSGRRASDCWRCYDREDKGLTSARQESNTFFQGELDRIATLADPSGSIDGGLRAIDFRLDSICNLRCRMCHPRYSSGLRPEWEALGLEGGLEEADNSWFERDSFWLDLFANSPNLEHVTIAGGETLLNRRFHWILDHLIEQNIAYRICLHFHTNLTVIDESVLRKLQKFKAVNFRVSLDGTGAVNDYIRHLSDWEKLTENVRLVNQWAKWPFIRVFMNVAVQAYNILNIAELIEFSLSLENFRPPKLQPVQEPAAFLVSTLPQEIRDQAVERLRPYLKLKDVPKSWTSYDRKKFQQNISELISCLENMRGQVGLEDFVKRTRAQDLYRNQSVHDFIPELSHLFKAPEEAPSVG